MSQAMVSFTRTVFLCASVSMCLFKSYWLSMEMMQMPLELRLAGHVFKTSSVHVITESKKGIEVRR